MMVRPANVGRSRACAQCKKKRIKCDLLSPSCQRCIDSRLKCSGPVSGLLFVSNNARPSPRRSGNQATNKSTTFSHQHPTPPTIRQSLKPEAVYDEVLLLRFLGYFSQAACGTWSPRLPELVACKNAPAMKSAARAVSLAFAAQNIGDVAMAAAACEYYVASLRHHQTSFITPNGKSISKIKAKTALPVTILLSYFEMIQATNPNAWLEHTFAAERLFRRLGRFSLQDNLLNHLYFVVRSNSAVRCLLSREKTLLLEDGWREVRMTLSCGKGTSVFLHLEDLVLWLSHGLNKSDKQSLKDTGDLTYDAPTLYKILDELVSLWAELADVVGFDADATPLLALGDHADGDAAASAPYDEIFMAPSPKIPDLPHYFQERPVSLTVAFHHAATIIVFILVQRATEATSSSDHPPPHLSSIIHHSNQILAAALYLEQQFSGCSCMRMIIPLAIVQRYSPNANQRLFAETVFRRWSTNDGLTGLGAVAFGSSSTLLEEAGGKQWASDIVRPQLSELKQMRQYGSSYEPPEEFKEMTYSVGRWG